MRAWGQQHREARAKGRAQRRDARAHLNDIEFGQQVAVGQRELVPVQESTVGGAELGLVGQLVGQGSAQVLVQLQQGPQEAPLQRCGGVAALLIRAWAPLCPQPCARSACPRPPALPALAPAPALPREPQHSHADDEGAVPEETQGGLERPREP